MDYCLKMPINQFFLMLERSFQLQGLAYSHQCDLMFIPAANVSYYEELKARYNRMAGIGEKKPEFTDLLNTQGITANLGKAKDPRSEMKKMAALVRRGLH